MKYAPLLHIVLHEPQIPPNTGNIGRTCVAVGARLWLIRPLGFEISEKQVRRAGLDYWPHLDWQVLDNWDALAAELATPLAAGRAWFFTKRAQQLYTEVAYQPGDMLVFGSETRGLPPELLDRYPTQAVRIPSRPVVRSLNLSAAAAAGIYEAVRQIGGLR